MAKGRRPAGTTGGEARTQLGDRWLWYRKERDDWTICWLDGRIVRRKSLGISGGTQNDPPEEAQAALAEHFLAPIAAPDQAPPPQEVWVDAITAKWLAEHVVTLEAPDRYAQSVMVWERYYDHLRTEGRMPEPYVVSSVKPAFVREFIRFRENDGVSAPTISRDIKALRSPINWAVTEGHLSAAPKILDVKGKGKRREIEWSPQEIAAILDAAAASPLRAHVLLYMMIFLSTNGRSEAILELDADKQIRDGLIYFNAPGCQQTRKKRSVVPIAPTLKPWLEGLEGKVIRYRAPTTQATRDAGGPDYFERPTADLGNSFKACLVEAGDRFPHFGLSEHVEDAAGNPIWLPPRRRIEATTADEGGGVAQYIAPFDSHVSGVARRAQSPDRHGGRSCHR